MEQGQGGRPRFLFIQPLFKGAGVGPLGGEDDPGVITEGNPLRVRGVIDLEEHGGVLSIARQGFLKGFFDFDGLVVHDVQVEIGVVGDQVHADVRAGQVEIEDPSDSFTVT